MSHRHNEAAEQHLDQYHKVHNHGFIALVDYMGNDERIVEAARQSTTGKSAGEAKDVALLNYMFENGHTSPFEMVETVWHVKMPIFVARQWVRHRTASLNEYSGRYSKMKPEFYIPTDARGIASGAQTVNIQGSGTSVDEESVYWLQGAFAEDQGIVWDSYEEALDRGFAKEMSRINLPLSTYTTWMWKMDLHNLFHFMRLRMHPHAQWEIQAYAEVMWPIIQSIAPIACEAFEEFVLEAKKLSRTARDELLGMALYAQDMNDAELLIDTVIEHLGTDELIHKLGK